MNEYGADTYHEALKYEDGEFKSCHLIESPNPKKLPKGFIGAIRTTEDFGGVSTSSVELVGFPPKGYLQAEDPINDAIYLQQNFTEKVFFPNNRMEELEALVERYSCPVNKDHYKVAEVGTETLYSFPHFENHASGKHLRVEDRNGEVIQDVSGTGLDQPVASIVDGHLHVEPRPKLDGIYLLANSYEGGYVGVSDSADPGSRMPPGGRVNDGESNEEAIRRHVKEAGWDLPDDLHLTEIETVDSEIPNSGKTMYVTPRNSSLRMNPDHDNPSLQPVSLSEDELTPRHLSYAVRGFRPKIRIGVTDTPCFVCEFDEETNSMETSVCRDPELAQSILDRQGTIYPGPLRRDVIELSDSMVGSFSGKSVYQLPYAVPDEDEAAHFVVLNNANQVIDFAKGTGPDTPRFFRDEENGFGFTSERKEKELSSMRGQPFRPDNLPPLVQSPEKMEDVRKSHYFILEEIADSSAPFRLHADTGNVSEALEKAKAGISEGKDLSITQGHLNEREVEKRRRAYVEEFAEYQNSKKLEQQAQTIEADNRQTDFLDSTDLDEAMEQKNPGMEL